MGAPGVRARVRAELTREIAEVARRHLASDGAAALSLRAVARELGMASSAVYRYFPSRDDLLTALIVDAYDALGAAAEEAERRGTPGPISRPLAGGVRAPSGAGRWPIRTSTRWSTARPCPATPRRRRRSGPPGGSASVLCRIVADGVAAGVVDPARATDPGADATIAARPRRGLGLPSDPTGSSRPARSRPGPACSA